MEISPRVENMLIYTEEKKFTKEQDQKLFLSISVNEMLEEYVWSKD